MDASLMYEALRSGSGDVISAYSTDGRIAAYGLTVLADDRGVIPPYDAIVLAGVDFLARSPEVAEAVASLAGRIDARAMRSLNAAVDLEGQRPEEVASTWVRDCLDADAVRDAGLTFVGPPGDVHRRMGDKAEARRTMIEAGVPTVPGSEGIVEDAEQAAAAAREMGYPLLIKASAGGGASPKAASRAGPRRSCTWSGWAAATFLSRTASRRGVENARAPP